MQQLPRKTIRSLLLGGLLLFASSPGARTMAIEAKNGGDDVIVAAASTTTSTTLHDGEVRVGSDEKHGREVGIGGLAGAGLFPHHHPDHPYLRLGALTPSQHSSSSSAAAAAATATTPRFLVNGPVVSTLCPNPRPPNPNDGLPDLQDIYVVNQPGRTVVVDGLLSDWNLPEDYVAVLWEAGLPDKPNPLPVGKVYLQWNCRTRTLCALLLMDDKYCMSSNAAERWFKDYGLGASTIPPLPPGIVTVVEGDDVMGWEGCFGPPGYDSSTWNGDYCRDNVPPTGNAPVIGVEFHADFGLCSDGTFGRTASPGSGNYFLGLDLHPNCFCSCDPILTCPEDQTVECTKDATYPPEDTGGDAVVTGTSSCGPFTSTVTHNDEPQTDTGVCPKKILRTFTANLDCVGAPAGHRTLTCLQTINVEDTKSPILSGLPSDETKECPEGPSSATVTANDQCQGPMGTIEPVPDFVHACGSTGTLTRTWSVEDQCGNDATAQRSTVIVDTKPPILEGLPPDETVECPKGPTAAIVTATDECQGPMGTVEPVPDFVKACGSTGTLTRTWSVEDQCGNDASAQRRTVIVDTTPPILEGLPPDETVECPKGPTAAIVTAKDECQGDLGTIEPVPDFVSGCGNTGTATRTWSARDECGNLASAQRRTVIVDTTPPVLVGVPGDATVSCDLVPAPADVTAKDTCGTATVAYSPSSTPGSCPQSYSIRRTWTATDQCGNTKQASQKITVQDITPPVLSCSPATIDCDAALPGVSAVDNCDPNPTLSIVSTQYDPNPIPPYSASDISQKITRQWKATDACGNEGTCNQVITLTSVLAEVKVKTTANGLASTFALYLGSYPPGSEIKKVTTTGSENAATVIDYYVKPDVLFTVCQQGVMATWTNAWKLYRNGVEVTPTPGFSYADAASGTYCVSYKALSCKDVLEFVVTNTRGGGCPRTPGYWKNWNRCSGGKQAATADSHGGAAAGYYLVEDLLPIVWDDTNADTKFFSISTCAAAVQVLSSKTLSTCAASPNTMFANDPVIALAKHLLATQLNAKANACISANITTTSKLAEKLLDDLNYVGCKLATAPSAATTSTLRTYSTILDDYNNGAWCPGCHG